MLMLLVFNVGGILFSGSILITPTEPDLILYFYGCSIIAVKMKVIHILMK